MAKTTKPEKSKSKSSKKAGVQASAKTKKKGGTSEVAETLEAGAPEGAKPKSPKHSREKAAPRRPLMPRTVFAKWGEGPDNWRLIDASGQTLGRLSSYIASVLMGKDKPTYTRFTDTGDHVVVINAKNVVLTGKKWSDKVYHHHTNYPGGIKGITANELLKQHPERLIELAVYRMLPKGHMGRKWYKKLRVFAGAEHTHTAQQPKSVTLPDLGTWERV